MSTSPSEILTDARTMWELVDRRAAASPDHPMLIAADGTTVTFAEFRNRAERVAAGLHGMGITTGSVVSWQLPTRIDTVVLSLALARLGAVQNPIIHLYREREVGFALRQTGASFFVIPRLWRDTDFEAIAERALADVPTRPTILTVDDGLPEADPAVLPPPPPGAAPEDAPIRWIYYTSGSTADPKGVQHTDQTLIAGGWGLARALDMGPDDVGSIAFPFAHIAGPDYLVTMLSFGFPAVLVEAFSAPDVLPIFRAHGATMVGGSTAFYVAYLAEQRKTPDDPILPSLRLMSGGGAAKPPEVHYEVRDEIGGRGVVHGYGMTEVPMISNGSPHDTDEQLANTDGKPVEGADVRIVRLDGTPAGPDDEGEVRVKGPMVFHGYTDPALTKEAFDEAGYFRTGDLGKLRADGHLSLTGRLKDVIVRKGENISAKEIEDLLYTHPKVVEVAVIGLPDPERGERVCAVVQLAEGENLELAEVVAFCRDAGLMTQKIPEQVEVRTDWPRAGTGKIVKKSLRDEYARVSPPTPSRLVLPGPIGDRPYRIVFVCTGNICRSPMAEVITRSLAGSTVLEDATTLATHVQVASAGTGPWHEGEPMHPFAAASLTLGGYSGERHVAHQFASSELGRTDLMVALDRRHQQTLRGLGADPDRLVLLRAFDPMAGAAADVPDPYYGDQSVFDDCRDMIAAACTGLVASLAAQWDSLWAA